MGTYSPSSSPMIPSSATNALEMHVHPLMNGLCREKNWGFYAQAGHRSPTGGRGPEWIITSMGGSHRCRDRGHCDCSLCPASIRASFSSLANWQVWLHFEGQVQYNGTFSCIHMPRVPRAVNCSLLAFCTKSLNSIFSPCLSIIRIIH